MSTGNPSADAPQARLRQIGSPWLLLAVFLVAVAAIALWKPPRPEPAHASWTLEDLLAHLKRADPALHIVYVRADRGTEFGFHVCDRDEAAVALPALARFGFGFLEVGPVTVEGSVAGPVVARRPDQQAIWLPAGQPALGPGRPGPAW